MTKKEAGSKGGRVTASRYGPGYMRLIGKRGAATTWTRYYMAPVGQTRYAMVERETGKIVATMEAR
jgi:hypothetical protein